MEKLSAVQTFFTGTSDHKLIKVTRFSKSFKHLPRYVRKRIFGKFNEDQFKQRINECKLDEILSYTDVNKAAETLTHKLTKILDEMAPVRKIQTRKNYAAWMSKETKTLKERREAAHERAVTTNNQEDWRYYKNLRNQVTANLREDKRQWEAKKLDLQINDSSGVWRTVKGWLG